MNHNNGMNNMKQDSNYTGPNKEGLSDEEHGKRLHRFFRDEQGMSSEEPSEVEVRAVQMMLSDEAGFYGYTWEQCLAMARKEIGGGGGAAIGGKSEPKQDETCHVCQLTKYERRGKPCTEIRCPNQFVDRGGKSDQREGGY